MDHADERDPARLFPVEQDVCADREGVEARAQIFRSVAAHSRVLRELPRRHAQPLEDASSAFRVILCDVIEDLLEVHLGLRRDRQPRHVYTAGLSSPRSSAKTASPS